MTDALSGITRSIAGLGSRPGDRIGILGGSFNPAHAGHVYISRVALRRLGLDAVWWLVSPQNPLKPARGMAGLAERMARARALLGPGRIRVTDLETRLGTRHTADTLKRLKSLLPGRRFVWLMGADNLIQVDQWKDWRALFRMVPIAVFPRPTYSLRALESRAAATFARHRRRKKGAERRLADQVSPAWVFLDVRTHGASATRIREGSGAQGQTIGSTAQRRKENRP